MAEKIRVQILNSLRLYIDSSNINTECFPNKKRAIKAPRLQRNKNPRT